MTATATWARVPVSSAVAVASLAVALAAVLLGGYAPHVLRDCPTPVLVLKRLQLPNALLAPFLPPAEQGWSLLLWPLLQAAGVALVASIELAVAKEHPTSSPRLLPALAALAWIGTLVVRVALGHVFSRALGWAYPALFFNSAAHECQTGLCTWLPALHLLTLPLWSAQSVTLRLTGRAYAVRTWALHTGTLLLLCTLQDGLWYTASACAATAVLLPFVVTQLVPAQGSGASHGSPVPARSSSGSRRGKGATSSSPSDSLPLPASSKRRRGAAKSRVQEAVLVIALGVVLLGAALAVRYIQPEEPHATPDDMLALLEPPYETLMTVLIVTVPRPHQAGHLWATLSSFLSSLPPIDRADGQLYRIAVVTSAPEHVEFADVQARLQGDRRVIFVQQEAPELHRLYHKQRRDFALAIGAARRTTNSRYIMFVEDDFPLCEDGWQRLADLLVSANVRVPDHCGLFVATGGSGLVFRADMAEALTRLLMPSPSQESLLREMHPDLIMQQCLRGVLDDAACAPCAETLVTSQRMLMRHVGFNTSTTMHFYSSDQYQCDWRQPFNGEADVVTL